METKPSSRVVPGFLCVAAGLLLLTAACTNDNNSSRSTSPAATPAPAATATTAPALTSGTNGAAEATVTAARAAATTVAAAAGTSIETPAPTTSSPTPGTANTPTGTTGAPTPTTGAPIPPTTTGPATSTTGPPVTTTAPNDTTDDTTTPTTEADTGDGDGTEHEPRNAIDRKYPIGSTQRQTYLSASGGVAPAGATVTIDLGGKDVASQHGRTSRDRFPNGIPAPPGSPDYSATTSGQRELQRAARWVAAMEQQRHRWDEIAPGYPPYWLQFVPTDDLTQYPGAQDYGPENPAMSELRSYWTKHSTGADGALVWEQPPAHVIWSHPRWRICGNLAFTKATDHANRGINTVPCEWVLDWAIWLVEQLANPQLANLGVHDQMRIAAHRWLAQLINTLPEAPASVNALWNVLALEMSRMDSAMYEVLYWLPTWVKVNIDDIGAWTNARFLLGFETFQRFAAEMDAGRRPWETVP